MSYCDWFTTSCSHLIGYSSCTHAIFDVIGHREGVMHDVHVITSWSCHDSRKGSPEELITHNRLTTKASKPLKMHSFTKHSYNSSRVTQWQSSTCYTGHSPGSLDPANANRDHRSSREDSWASLLSCRHCLWQVCSCHSILGGGGHIITWIWVPHFCLTDRASCPLIL